MRAERRICGVILTYNPGLAALRHLAERIINQVDAVVVVDNTPARSLQEQIRATVRDSTYIPMRGNQGVAKGFNAGIEWARDHDFTHVLLLDQDSLPGERMVHALYHGEMQLLGQGVNLAAVGPAFSDPKYHVIRPFTRTEKWRVRRFHCAGAEDPAHIQVDFVISSGSLIRTAVFATAGLLEEGLFIDYVDIEWALRARSRGLHSFGICAATMEHSLAERAVTFRWLNNRSVPVHAPLRHYYYFRNALLLYRRPYIPVIWKLRDLGMLVLKAGFFSSVPRPRLARFRMIALGLYDGLFGHSGPCRWQPINAEANLPPA